MTAANALRLTLARIERPGTWTQGALARRSVSSALELKPKSDKAACFCLIGALQSLDISNRDFERAIMLLRNACGMSPMAFNDKHNHKMVIAALKRAIEQAEREECQLL